MPQLDPTYFPSQLFWLVATFILLYGLVSRLIAPKFESTLIKRKVQIDDDLDYAEQLKREAQLLRDECDQILKVAQDEAREILVTSQLDIKHEIEDLTAKLEEELQEELSKSEANLMIVASTVREELTPEIERIVGDVIQKLSSTQTNGQPKGGNHKTLSLAGAPNV